MARRSRNDKSSVALQPFHRLAHAPELFGMAIAANLQRKSQGESGAGLPQTHPSLLCQFLQLIARPLVKPGVRQKGFFFSITVVPTVTRLALFSTITQDLCPAQMVWVSSISTPSSPIRPRQRVSDDGSIGGRCWKSVSTVKC
jgi:hypothetical protein